MKNVRVLIVDDSIIFRSQIRSALDGISGIEIAGTCANGRIALDKLQQTSVDLVTLDMEMPELNGLQTLDELKSRSSKAKVIVFSSQTARGADLALEALSRGAHDVVPKPAMSNNSSLEEALAQVRSELVPKILQFVGKSDGETELPDLSTVGSQSVIDVNTFRPSAIVIGSSTGGPDALEKIFSHLKGPMVCPIFIAQHMPPVFTESLAKRLGQLSGIECREGKQWELVQPNHIYVAPGDYHMTVALDGRDKRIRLDQGPLRNSVRPAVDNLFESAAAVYENKLAAFVLTGMGEDGRAGAKAIKASGGSMMIQDKDSCVVFGMPGAIYQSGLFDRMGDLPSIWSVLQRMVKRNED